MFINDESFRHLGRRRAKAKAPANNIPIEAGSGIGAWSEKLAKRVPRVNLKVVMGTSLVNINETVGLPGTVEPSIL